MSATEGQSGLLKLSQGRRNWGGALGAVAHLSQLLEGLSLPSFTVFTGTHHFMCHVVYSLSSPNQSLNFTRRIVPIVVSRCAFCCFGEKSASKGDLVGVVLTILTRASRAVFANTTKA